MTLCVPPHPAIGRAEAAAENRELAAEFTARFREVIQSNGLEYEVDRVGEPTNLPFVIIEVTNRVAEIVRRMPEVECVTRDCNLIEPIV